MSTLIETAPVVVTGIGAVSPTGIGADEHWDATLAGRSGLARFERFDPSSYPVQVGGEVIGFDVKAHVPGKLRPQTDRVTQLSLAAAGWALRDAVVDVAEQGEYDVGVVTANTCGGFEFGQRELQKLWGTGPHLVSAYQSFAWFYAVNTGQISILYGIKGHSSVVSTEQAGGLDALAHGARLLRNGTLRIALSGGLDAPLCPWGMAAQIPNGRMSEVTDPAHAFLPFGRSASGYSPGEGGAMLVLEKADDARARGVDRLYGELAGYTATFDPPPDSGRPSSLARAVHGALNKAHVTPADVDVVIADAAGVPELDAIEADTIAGIFGPRGVPVAVPKTLVGRLYSGGAPLDVVNALLMIRDGVVPGAPDHLDVPDEYAIDVVVGEPRQLRVRTVLVIARGNGGFNSAVVVRAV